MFYKSSWRANDWMWGDAGLRPGGSCTPLLDPRQLHRLAAEAPDRGAFAGGLEQALAKLAGAEAPPDVAAELSFLTADEALRLASLPRTSMWVASGLQRIIAGEELAHVAEQIGVDKSSGADETGTGRFISAYWEAAPGSGYRYPVVPAENAEEVLRACRVSAETLPAEHGPLIVQTITRTVSIAMRLVTLPADTTSHSHLIEPDRLADRLQAQRRARCLHRHSQQADIWFSRWLLQARPTAAAPRPAPAPSFSSAAQAWSSNWLDCCS